jgi:hypothetical protein
MKAALLSALVFPGSGHFYLKKNMIGTVLAVAALASLYLLVSNAVERALSITEEIQSGAVPLDVVAITELITRQLGGTEGQVLNFASAVLLISWLIGIVDSYRVGHLQSKS